MLGAGGAIRTGSSGTRWADHRTEARAPAGSGCHASRTASEQRRARRPLGGRGRAEPDRLRARRGARARRRASPRSRGVVGAVGVADERGISGQRRHRRELRLEARAVVDRDHQPAEERADRVRADVPALRVAAAGEQWRRRDERRDHDVVDRRGVEPAAERQVLVRDAEPVDEANRGPTRTSSERGIGEPWVIVRRSPRPSAVAQ